MMSSDGAEYTHIAKLVVKSIMVILSKDGRAVNGEQVYQMHGTEAGSPCGNQASA